MPYLSIDDFRHGMDRRRPRVAGIPGSLWTLENAFISRGGDIVRAKKFVPEYELPAGTTGFAHLRGQLYVFGSGFQPVNMPPSLQYLRLQSAGGAALAKVLDVHAFEGELVTLAEFDDGSVAMFVGEDRVTGWDTLAANAVSLETTAEMFAAKINRVPGLRASVHGMTVTVESMEAGTPFAFDGGATDAGSGSTPRMTFTHPVPNRRASDAVSAKATIQIDGSSSLDAITSIQIDGRELIHEPVVWAQDNNATATRVAAALDAYEGYTGVVLGTGVVEIEAPINTGAGHNGKTVVVQTTGGMTVNVTNFAGGADAVEAQRQISRVTVSAANVDPDDVFWVNVNGERVRVTNQSAAMPTSLFVQRKRVWATAGRLIYYSALVNARDWTTTTPAETGAGLINPTAESEGSLQLTAAGEYNGQGAFFTEDNIRIYALNEDATASAYQQTLDNTGTISPRSVVQYGNNDLFYLDDSGVRSVRSRDGYNAAYVDDVGTAMDTYIDGLRATLTDGQVRDATAIVDPLDGRYWLALADQILCLSFFPGARITAWSVLKPGFGIDQVLRVNRRVYARSGDTIYLYGGVNGDVYPQDYEQEIVVELPFLTANDPAGPKSFTGVDICGINTWHVTALLRTEGGGTVDFGQMEGTTYDKLTHATNGLSTHLALRLTCDIGGYAALSGLALHYEKGRAT